MDAIATELQGWVDQGQIAGAVTLVWRDGVVHAAGVGLRDREAGLPMQRDSLFRIASMTKPITATAALMLFDEGRFALDDPISRWAPAFGSMRVLRSPEGALDDTVPAERPITMLDLLTHRSGITVGGFHAGPIGAAYGRAFGMDIDSPLSPDDWIAAMAELPLIDQPGANFHYGFSSELLGLLIARIAGQSLGELLAERIFRPLGMSDTGFLVPPGKHHRRARMYGFDDAGGLEPRPMHPPEGPAFLAERPASLTFESGGAGLWSTADDYLKFARMFVGDGAVDGVRLLKVETVRRMTANHLTPEQVEAATLLGLPVFSGQGFGLGVAVVTDPDRAEVQRGRGGLGTVAWPGAYGGWWQADPTDGAVMIFLAQNALDFDKAANGVGLGVYGAISRFHALASAAA